MPAPSSTPLLPFALWADAAATGASAVLLLAAGPQLEALIGMPAGQLRLVGAGFVAWVALVTLAARGWPARRGLTRAVVAGNVAFVAGAAALAALAPLTALGRAFWAAMAAAVALLALLQALGLRAPATSPAGR